MAGIEYEDPHALHQSMRSGIILGVSDFTAKEWSQKPPEPEGEDDKKKKDAKKDKKKGAADGDSTKSKWASRRWRGVCASAPAGCSPHTA